MIEAKVDKILTSNDVSYLRFSVGGSHFLHMLSLENLNLKVGDNVHLSFKSSDVIIALNPLQNCSMKNEMSCVITDLNVGEILSVLELKFLDFSFESIITTSSLKALNLKKGDSVFAYVKSTSLFISEIL